MVTIKFSLHNLLFETAIGPIALETQPPERRLSHLDLHLNSSE